MFCRFPLRAIVSLLAALALLFGSLSTAHAERRPAPKLLPKDTVFFLRVADSRDLMKRFQATALGRIGQDENIRPLLTQLYGSAARAFEAIEMRLGVSLTKLLAIPQGEVVVAAALVEKRPALIFLLDAGEELESVTKLLAAGETEATNNGAQITPETIAGVEMKVLTSGSGDPIYYGFRDSTFVLTTHQALVEHLFGAWNAGDKEETAPVLTKNEKFAAVMSRCQGPKDEPPQVTWFVDPLELFTAASRGNAAASQVLIFLPILGLDGFEAAGGSLAFDTADFDMITHAHFLISNPRSGVLDMIALDGGDSEPESWAPNDAASYSTFHWNVQRTYDAAAKLADSIRGEGSTARLVKERLSTPTGLDFEADVIPALEGRFTMLSWMEPPARFNSQASLFAAKLKDAKEFAPKLDAALAKFEGAFEKKLYGAGSYYESARALGGPPRQPDAEGAEPAPEQPNPAPPGPRRPRLFGGTPVKPCLGIVGDYLVVTDRAGLMERILAVQADPQQSLAADLEYKLIASKIRRQLGSVAKPGLITFNRPEEGMRNLYGMLTDPENRQRITELAETNEFFRSLDQALTDNPLPPFAAIARYLAPGGGLLTNEETGFHYLGFSLKRRGEGE